MTALSPPAEAPHKPVTYCHPGFSGALMHAPMEFTWIGSTDLSRFNAPSLLRSAISQRSWILCRDALSKARDYNLSCSVRGLGSLGRR